MVCYKYSMASGARYLFLVQFSQVIQHCDIRILAVMSRTSGTQDLGQMVVVEAEWQPTLGIGLEETSSIIA